jgi:hypothetical protein
MDSTEINRIANDVVRAILTEDIEFGCVSDREDCYDLSGRDLTAIHDRATEVLRKVAANFRAENGANE